MRYESQASRVFDPAWTGSFDFAQDKLRPVPIRTKKNL